MPTFFSLAAACCVLGLTACAGLAPPAERTHAAQQLAARAGWQSEYLEAGRFRLLSLHPEPPVQGVAELAVFIEGDGLAWVDRGTPSADPTPRSPLGLELALAEPELPSAYLGRPCQYDPEGTPGRCRTADWTNARFSAEIILAMDSAVSRLKQRFQAQRLVLVGYSGGAAIAALLAARRDDVAQLVTVAGLLDHVEWTQEMRVSPLSGSLNPADAWGRLRQLGQVHYVGGQDAQTGRLAMRPALADAPSNEQIHIVEMPDFSHSCCWVQAWPQLARERALKFPVP